MKKLVLIDGHALVHRAFHALPPTLNSPKGVPTNAVYGFTSVLLKMIKDLKPDYIAATFDLAAPTFRHEEFAEYKIHRQKAPDELYAQIGMVKDLLRIFGVARYEKEGFEADDLIGSVAEQAKKRKFAFHKARAYFLPSLRVHFFGNHVFGKSIDATQDRMAGVCLRHALYCPSEVMAIEPNRYKRNIIVHFCD
ncbi:MAG: PIN domain-containing protein, partial [Patescibacteria group bacterium]